MTIQKIDQSPLHKRVAEKIRAHIRQEMQPNQQLQPESVLAKQLGVSLQTVREALSALAQEGLVERRHGRGTFVADYPTHPLVGLWWGIDPFRPPFIYPTRVLSGLSVWLLRHGLESKVYCPCVPFENLEQSPACREFLRDIRHQRLSAVAIIHGILPEGAHELMKNCRVPMVGNAIKDGSMDYAVGTSYVEVLRAGVRRLVDEGCRRIAWLGWGVPEVADRERDQLYQTFRDSLRESGVVLREAWIRGDLDPSLEGAGYAEFREIWTGAAEKPDGVLITDDILFQDVITAIQELRIAVPAQLKVVAMANKGAVTCPFFPATRLEVDPAALGQAFAEMVAKLVRGEPVSPRQVAVPFRWREAGRAEPVPAVERQQDAPREFPKPNVLAQ